MTRSTARWRVRRARPDVAQALSALALRSKAVWGYSADFLDRCRPVLTLTPDDIAGQPVFVAEGADGVGGFCALGPRAGTLELDLLFVEPALLRQGLGALLLDHARRVARSLGYVSLLIESDPGAEPFYVRAGARRVGAVASEVEPGRLLPLLVLDLQAEPGP